MMARADSPFGIDRARHQDLTGRNHHVWWRRGTIAVIAAIPVLALLNVFGQHSTPLTYQSPAASLLIDSPAHARGGLVFTTHIVITPHQPLRDAKLYLSNGWFQAMSLNGIAPQPSTQTAQGAWQVWDFGKIPAGTAFHVWISWQVNPTNIGRHSQPVALYDGGTLLMTAPHTLTVFP
jgi:hypothetical protein